MKNFKVSAYCDGACRNPGPGAYAVIMRDNDTGYVIEGGGYLEETTNNRAEMHAVIRALKRCRHPERTELTVFTDSQLVVGFMQKNWRPKVNSDLVEGMKELARRFARIDWVKVAGHSPEIDDDHHWHDRADKLAVKILANKGSQGMLVAEEDVYKK
jgi:ribonuclease HI